MKNLALSILALLFSFCLVGQTGTVRGKLVDTTALELSNATISVLLKKDTSLVSYTLSDSKGYFEIKNLSYTDYVIFISFTGLSATMTRDNSLYSGQSIINPKSEMRLFAEIEKELV